MDGKFLAVLAIFVLLDEAPSGCNGCDDDNNLYSEEYIDTDPGSDENTDVETDTSSPDASVKDNQESMSRSSISVLIKYYESLRK